MNARTEQHFEAGPSRLDRVIACPGSVVASRGIDEGPMPAAEHGKRLLQNFLAMKEGERQAMG